MSATVSTGNNTGLPDGFKIATDVIGAASAPAAGDEVQYVKLDLGAAGASAPAVGTLPVSAAALPLPAGAATDATLTAVGVAVTALTRPSDTQAIAGTVAVSNLPATQAVSAAALPLPAGASTEATLALIKAKTDNLDVAVSTRTKPADTQKVDGSGVTQPVSDSGGSLTVDASDATFGATVTPKAASVWDVADRAARLVGVVSISATSIAPKSNNAGAPGAANVGVISALANAAAPAWTEGNQVAASTDLAGSVRVVPRSPKVLGSYGINSNVAYTATTLNGEIFAFRWGSAAAFCRLVRVRVMVLCTAFTTAGIVERQLIIARAFTASNTSGTAISLTGNNNKRKTSDATSLVTDARIGGFLTAGTRTLDAQPYASVSTWMAAIGVLIPMTTLYEAPTDMENGIVFAQNEGFLIRLGAAETASTRQTFVNVEWDERSAL